MMTIPEFAPHLRAKWKMTWKLIDFKIDFSFEVTILEVIYFSHFDIIRRQSATSHREITPTCHCKIFKFIEKNDHFLSKNAVRDRLNHLKWKRPAGMWPFHLIYFNEMNWMHPIWCNKTWIDGSIFSLKMNHFKWFNQNGLFNRPQNHQNRSWPFIEIGNYKKPHYLPRGDQSWF